MLQGVTAVWFLIVVLRIFAVLLFPNDTHEITGRREQAADFWSSIMRTVAVAPAISFFYILKAKTPDSGDPLVLILTVQAAWFMLNLAIFAFWVFMSKRKGGRWGY